MSYTPVAQRRTTTKIDYIPVSRRTPQEKTPILSPFQLNLSIGRTQTTTPVIAEQGTVEEAGILGREVGQSISRNVASLVGSEAIAPVVNPVVKKIVDLEQKSPFFKAFTEDLGQRLYGDVEDLTPVEITGETRGEQIAPIGERVLAFEKRLEDKKKEYDELLKTPDLSKKERLILETLSAIIGEKKGTLAPVIIGSLVGLDVVPSFGSTDDFFKAMIKAQSRGEVVSLLRKVNVAEDLIEQFADDVVKVSSKKDAEKLFGSIAELQQSTKVVPRIAPELQPLAQEARKYKSAEEFVSKINKEVPITKDRFGRTSLIRTQDTLPPLEAGHIRLYRAEGGKRNFDTALRKTNISELPKGFVEGDTNFYTPSLADADFYAKEYGAKIKYIDVPESLAQKINPSEYLVSKSQLTDFYTQATKGVGGIRGGK